MKRKMEKQQYKQTSASVYGSEPPSPMIYLESLLGWCIAIIIFLLKHVVYNAVTDISYFAFGRRHALTQSFTGIGHII